MHEESLIRALMEQVTLLAAQHRAIRIDAIEVETGPLSGVEPLLLMSTYARMTAATTFADCRLRIKEVPLSVKCRHCAAEFCLNDFRFLCSHCGRKSLTVLSGDAFRLLNVQLTVDSPAS